MNKDSQLVLLDVEKWIVANSGDDEDVKEVGQELYGHILGMSWASSGYSHPSRPAADLVYQEKYDCHRRTLHNSESRLALRPMVGTSETETDTVATGENKYVDKPFSVLFLLTREAGGVLSATLNVHGSFAVVKKKLKNADFLSSDNNRVLTATSYNATHFAVSQLRSDHVTVISCPALSTRQSEVQALSNAYISMRRQLCALDQLVAEIAATWKSSVKPLDSKLNSLVKLLKDYGILEQMSLKEVLVHHILYGESRDTSTVNNAIDQYFTGVQMNSQLMTRMERSLDAGVANVEKQLRTKLRASAQTLVFHSSQLYGMARSDTHALPLALTQDAKQLLICCKVLLACLDSAVDSVSDAQLRIKDLLDWLRATASQVKARGTAPGSVQRNDAEKKRVADNVVQRLLEYFGESASCSPTSEITEKVLGLNFYARLISHDHEGNTEKDQSSYPSLVTILKATSKAFACTFDRPCKVFSDDCAYRHFLVDDTKLCATTFRQGSGNLDYEDVLYGDPHPTGFFCPAPEAQEFRQWLVVARTLSTAERNDSLIQIDSIPMGWNTSVLPSDTLWRSSLRIPAKYGEILDMSFYVDKSKCSSDTGNGSEGERKSHLGIRLRGPSESSFWLVPYEDLPFTESKMTSDTNGVDALTLHNMCGACVSVEPQLCDQETHDSMAVRARLLDNSCTEMMLNGSRGMGLAVSNLASGRLVSFFDLEEDECDSVPEEMDES